MGFDLGLELAGVHPTLAVDVDRWCCESIRGNRPNLVILQQDVSALTGGDLRAARGGKGDVDLMVGGPPCQSFSPGGKRSALSDPRGNLIYEYLRLISEVRPRFFVLENVANLVTAALKHRPIKDRPGKHWSLKTYESGRLNDKDGAVPMLPEELSGSAVRQVLSDTESLGYRLSFAVVDAAEYGAPQHRLRFLMLGSRDTAAPPVPPPTHGPAGSGLRPFRTVRDAIADLTSEPGPHSQYTEEVARFFRLVPPGGNWRDLPNELQRDAMGGSFEAGGGKTGFYRRLSWDAPSPTITGRANRKGSALCHPEATRPLSVRECARMQGFPDEWRLAGAMAQQYLQVGNAVPVYFGRAIGASLSGILDGTHVPTDHQLDHETMLRRAVQRLRGAGRNKRGLKGALSLFGAEEEE